MVRLAKIDDINEVSQIYEDAKKKFATEGYFQWKGNYPSKESFINDLKNYLVLVCVEQNSVVGVSTVQFAIDHNYDKIDGAWLNDEPYISVHRIATSSTKYKAGVGTLLFKEIIKIAKEKKIYNIRVDTHRENKSMQGLLLKLNFIQTGVIELLHRDDLTDNLRLAYQLVIKENDL